MTDNSTEGTSMEEEYLLSWGLTPNGSSQRNATAGSISSFQGSTSASLSADELGSGDYDSETASLLGRLFSSTTDEIESSGEGEPYSLFTAGVVSTDRESSDVYHTNLEITTSQTQPVETTSPRDIFQTPNSTAELSGENHDISTQIFENTSDFVTNRGALSETVTSAMQRQHSSTAPEPTVEVTIMSVSNYTEVNDEASTTLVPVTNVTSEVPSATTQGVVNDGAEDLSTESHGSLINTADGVSEASNVTTEGVDVTGISTQVSLEVTETTYVTDSITDSEGIISDATSSDSYDTTSDIDVTLSESSGSHLTSYYSKIFTTSVSPHIGSTAGVDIRTTETTFPMTSVADGVTTVEAENITSGGGYISYPGGEVTPSPVSGGASTVLIIGVGIGVGALLVIALLVGVLVLKKRCDDKKQRKKYGRDEEDVQDYQYDIPPRHVNCNDETRIKNGSVNFPAPAQFDNPSYDDIIKTKPGPKNYFQEGLRKEEEDANHNHPVYEEPVVMRRDKGGTPLQDLEEKSRPISMGPIYLQDDMASTQKTYDTIYTTHNTFKRGKRK